MGEELRAPQTGNQEKSPLVTGGDIFPAWLVMDGWMDGWMDDKDE
jgi:hypothetical protein